ncbi:MAG: hypothetical protein IT348_05725 [Candidatus Eisenbacteria bacterium]|nr:hypothetical protein [Candidatus Eisenbacteria bacterium]
MRGLSEYPRMLFRDGPAGEVERVVADAAEKAAAIAEGWHTKHIAWCDGPLPEPEPEAKPTSRRKAAPAE